MNKRLRLMKRQVVSLERMVARAGMEEVVRMACCVDGGEAPEYEVEGAARCLIAEGLVCLTRAAEKMRAEPSEDARTLKWCDTVAECEAARRKKREELDAIGR